MGPASREPSALFDRWLRDVMSGAPLEREARLCGWARAPAARLAHPREEHLLPLMVAAGAAPGEPGACVFHEDTHFGHASVSGFRFG